MEKKQLNTMWRAAENLLGHVRHGTARTGQLTGHNRKKSKVPATVTSRLGEEQSRTPGLSSRRCHRQV